MERKRIYTLLAELLDYPATPPERSAVEWGEALTAAGIDHTLPEFDAFMRESPAGQIEETYTATFDVNPACYIYAGYILFGESFKRGEFLVKLKEKYRERGFDVGGSELADHLSVIFRFMATLDENDILARELAEDCLAPTLTAMIGALKVKEAGQAENPWSGVLRAALALLTKYYPAAAVADEPKTYRRLPIPDCSFCPTNTD